MSCVWVCGGTLQTPVNHCQGRRRATVGLEDFEPDVVSNREKPTCIKNNYKVTVPEDRVWVNDTNLLDFFFLKKSSCSLRNVWLQKGGWAGSWKWLGEIIWGRLSCQPRGASQHGGSPAQRKLPTSLPQVTVTGPSRTLSLDMKSHRGAYWLQGAWIKAQTVGGEYGDNGRTVEGQRRRGELPAN